MIIHTDGTTETPFEKGKAITLDDAQKAVGGYIEYLSLNANRLFPNAVMIVNEDGMQMELDDNEYATYIADGLSDYYGLGIIGDVIIATVTDDGDAIPLTEEEERMIQAMLEGYDELYGEQED